MKRFVTNKHWWLIPPALVTVVAVLFGYQNTLAEPDLARMVTGLVYGGVTGEGLAAGHHYGAQFSFGYYELLYRLIPEDTLRDPDFIALFINDISFAFSALFALGLGLMLDELIGSHAAAFSTFAFIFSPVGLPFLVSGHPMIGACALLFFGTWLLLRAGEAVSMMIRTLTILAAFVAFTSGLSLRAEIALAFPFVMAAVVLGAGQGTTFRPNRAVGVGLILAAAYGFFLYFQQPFIKTHGSATATLASFWEQAASIGRVARGMVVLVISLGFGTALLLGTVIRIRRDALSPKVPLLLTCMVLIVPSLIFWLPNPQPARHFILPILGTYMILGVILHDKINRLKNMILIAFALALGNQLLAEMVRPIIVKRYQWSYDTGDKRRATQQLSLGMFPLDQRANIDATTVSRIEGIQLARSRPERLLVLADSQQYMIARLLAADPALRIVVTRVGDFDATLLTYAEKKIYFIEKYTSWPRDVLSEILKESTFEDYKIYVQPQSISRYDKSQVPEDRKYRLPAE